MKVSVIIPVYNEEKVVGDCLRSLNKQNMRDFEVIAIDDGSTDRTREILKQLEGDINNLKILKQKHKGAGAARNLGAKRAKGEILVFVDADMTFQKNFLKKLVAPIVSGEAKGSWSGEEYVSNWDNVWARCWNYNEGISEKNRLKDDEVPQVFRAIKKSEFRKVGGFRSGGYTDDYSLSEKLGYKPLEVKEARFYHNNPDSLREVYAQAKWVGKRKYKLGLLGVIFALLRVSLPISKLVGIYKAVKYKTPRFFIFKIVYNTGITVGIVDYYLFKNKAK